jgi:hypothetical protein
MRYLLFLAVWTVFGTTLIYVYEGRLAFAASKDVGVEEWSYYAVGEKCVVAMSSDEIISAGSFFGSSVTGHYQFEVKFRRIGPFLLIRPSGLLNTDKSEFYTASKVSSNCREIKIEFDEVFHVKKWGPYVLRQTTPSRRIKLKATRVYGRPEEGEFREEDLRVEIYRDNKTKPIDKFIMLRAIRYKSPSSDKDKKIATELDKMSREICDVVFDSADGEHAQCVLSMKGDVSIKLE